MAFSNLLKGEIILEFLKIKKNLIKLLKKGSIIIILLLMSLREYIEKLFMEEKGIIKIDEDFLKKENKQIRNLSQVSYRLLNFNLCSHLFFVKLYTENKKFIINCRSYGLDKNA